LKFKSDLKIESCSESNVVDLPRPVDNKMPCRQTI